MGSYAHVYVGRLEFDWSKNGVHGFYLGLFSSDEKTVVVSSDTQLPFAIMRGYVGEPFKATPDDPAVYYATSLNALRDRLDSMGYTLEVAKDCFECAFKEQAENWNQYRIRPLPANLDPDTWMAGLLELHQSAETDEAEATLGEIASYMKNEKDRAYGAPPEDIFVVLRLAAEALNSEELFVYDLTDIANGGWVDHEDELVRRQTEELVETYSLNSPVVVLTEGSSDSRFIEASLRLLYPHMVERYAFLDFSSKLAGSADELVKLVKGFVAARIPNRVIAVFDADAAARDKRRQLERVELPSRIAIRELPPIELLRKYPCRGPSGFEVADVHGRAASIELYFGEDVLQGSENALPPIKWKAYVDAVDAWQGEVEGKRAIQQRFEEKLKRTTVVPAEGDPAWRDMRAVCRVLLEAFRQIDRERIIKACCDGGM